MNTAGWTQIVTELEAGESGPWKCPEHQDADVEVSPKYSGDEIVEWHLRCPRCGAEIFVRRGPTARTSP